jgi:hypothetical protein
MFAHTVLCSEAAPQLGLGYEVSMELDQEPPYFTVVREILCWEGARKSAGQATLVDLVPTDGERRVFSRVIHPIYLNFR